MFVGVTIVPSAAECLMFCSSTSGCEFFTHYSADDTCFAFVNCVNYSEGSCFDCLSGDADCADVSCNVPGRCDGTLVDFFSVTSKQQCVDLCFEDDRCAWWTHEADNGLCTLTSDCPILDEGCASCLSGEKFCGAAGNGRSYR